MTENQLTTGMSIQEDVLRLRLENEQLKQEKCELLGIIQKKDELISKFVKELEQLKQQIEKMKCCRNCKFQDMYGDCVLEAPIWCNKIYENGSDEWELIE